MHLALIGVFIGGHGNEMVPWGRHWPGTVFFTRDVKPGERVGKDDIVSFVERDRC